MNKINLFVNYYIDKNSERQKEIDYCFQKNLQNPLLNVFVIKSQERITFNNFFNYANKVSFDSNVNIIANSDIYFDQLIGLSLEHLKNNEAWCLSRWDLQNDLDAPAVLFDRSDSQDCFLWRGKININADFVLGFRGSDNRICRVFHDNGYKVINPSRTVKSYHLHNTAIRNYDLTDKFLVRGPYWFPEPTTLENRYNK